MSDKEKLEKAIAAMKESINFCGADAKENVLIRVLKEIGEEVKQYQKPRYIGG